MQSTGKIVLFNEKERTVVTSRWSFHSARINALAWTPDGTHVASASLDTHAYVWSVARPLKTIALKNAGPGGVNTVLWLETDGAKGGKLATAGADACVRTWDVKFHA
jgi:WD40 repeat protein